LFDSRWPVKSGEMCCRAASRGVVEMRASS
jgi:hypothetical protein